MNVNVDFLDNSLKVTPLVQSVDLDTLNVKVVGSSPKLGA